MSNQEQRFKIVTPNNEIITTEPGKNGENDMKIFTKFPFMPWPHSLYYIGVCLRLKGMVEERNYPPGEGRQGKAYLMNFISECVFNNHIPISEICKKYKIKTKE